MIKFRMMRLTCHVGSIGQKLAQSFFRKIWRKETTKKTWT
jgi:hypothetical protein